MLSVAWAGVTPPASTMARNTRISRRSRSVSWENMGSVDVETDTSMLIDVKFSLFAFYLYGKCTRMKIQPARVASGLPWPPDFPVSSSLASHDETFLLRFPGRHCRAAATPFRQRNGSLRRHHDDDAPAVRRVGRRSGRVLC